MGNNVNQNILLIIATIIIALGIAFAGSQINEGLTEFRSFDRSVSVKGLAERDVEADLALWSISYTETGNDLTVLQNKMDAHGKTLLNFLTRHGIKGTEIELRQVNVQDLMAQSYRQNYASNRYILTQNYMVRTTNIDTVDKASKDMGSLIRAGIVFAQTQSVTPTYIFTKLNEIKPAMIAEATVNAREAAKEFASNSGQEVEGIKYASQGYFQILPRDDTRTIQEAQQRNKKVRVVSTIQFYLDD